MTSLKKGLTATEAVTKAIQVLEVSLFLKRDNCIYPRVTSFDALYKQSTGICAQLITFSSRKYIILNKLSCFQSKHTFWEVREHLFV